MRRSFWEIWKEERTSLPPSQKDHFRYMVFFFFISYYILRALAFHLFNPKYDVQDLFRLPSVRVLLLAMGYWWCLSVTNLFAQSSGWTLWNPLWCHRQGSRVGVPANKYNCSPLLFHLKGNGQGIGRWFDEGWHPMYFLLHFTCRSSELDCVKWTYKI